MSANLQNTLLSAVLGASLLAGCAPATSPDVIQKSAPVPGLPDAYYRRAEAEGARVLRVIPARSLLTIEVRRGGPLAGLGHDHVVASRDIQGYIAPEQGRADLMVALDRLTVDEPELRREAGFNTQPPSDAIEGTRRNMMEKVLGVDRFPHAFVHIERITMQAPLRVTITLRGVAKSFDVPVRIEPVPGGIAVSGRMDFRQSDFGIIPFSVLGGALQVQDRLDLKFRIEAGA
jgi:hypothetical protein